MHMAQSERMSISISKERVAKIREFVGAGVYPSLSAAMDSAAVVLLEQEAEKKAWWAETVRRCKEAEKHPEQLLDADTFFQGVRKEIASRKQRPRAK